MNRRILCAVLALAAALVIITVITINVLNKDTARIKITRIRPTSVHGSVLVAPTANLSPGVKVASYGHVQQNGLFSNQVQISSQKKLTKHVLA